MIEAGEYRVLHGQLYVQVPVDQWPDWYQERRSDKIAWKARLLNRRIAWRVNLNLLQDRLMGRMP